MKYSSDLNLGEGQDFPDSGLYLLNGFDFVFLFFFNYFEWRDTENHQYGVHSFQNNQYQENF